MDNKDTSTKKLLATITIIIVFALSTTYALLALNASKNVATGTAGCFEVNYSAQAIETQDLVSTTNYLEGASTEVTLSKNEDCDIYTDASIYIHTTTESTTAPINDVQALKYKIFEGETELSSGVITTSENSDVKIATVDLTTTPTTYKIYIWVDSEVSAGSYHGTTYSGYIYAESIQSSTVIYASDYIINKYNDGSTITTVNIGGNSSKPQVHLNATQGIMLDNNGEYRYYGADPNNYVSYNDELWRIISVGNVKSSETDTIGETRIKIVKADILRDDNGLSYYSYDSSDSTVNSGYGVNDWSQADLMTELNTLYLNSTSGTCYTGQNNATTACNFTNTGLSVEARNLTADALYYLGGNLTTSVYPNDYYTFERGTRVWGSTSGQTCNDGACPRATTWTGRVGIIYPSDYVYATDLSICTEKGFNYDNDDNCINNDWLHFKIVRWTISPDASYADRAFYIYTLGYVNNDVSARVYNGGAVLPVQYLRSEVIIVKGEGTSENPYILGI